MSSRVTKRTAVAATLLLVPLAAAADDAAEQSLKRFFEGRDVVVLLDMPASQSGIDVYPEREYPLDYGKVSGRIGESGISVRRGQRITVTRVHLKDDLVEFQLGGGGFSSFRHGSSAISPRITPKSSHERELERRIQRESDPDERRQLKRDLDRVRRQREYLDEQNRAMAEIANERRRAEDRERARDLGSRFNVRFEKKDVPAAYRQPRGHRARARAVRGLPGSRSPASAPGRGPRARRVPGRARRRRAQGHDARGGRGGLRGAASAEDDSREGELDVTVAAYERGRRARRGHLRGRRGGPVASLERH